MKLNLLYLSALIALVIYGCGGSKSGNPQPIPDGTYTGKFRLIHIHSNNRNLFDTLAQANLSIHFSPVSTGTFTVTGDTATVHAGSKGSFIPDNLNHTIFFIDSTYPKAGTPTKTHLSGSYAYLYDGSELQMAAFGPQDTLELQYDLKKTGN